MMNEIEIALDKLIRRSDPKTITGNVVDRSLFDELNQKTNNIIPQWLIDIYVNYPFSNLALEIPDPDEEDFKHYLHISPPNWIENELFDLAPGCFIAVLGYICIAEDESGSGDPYFINVHEGFNPPVYQIYHDISDNGEEILKEGKTKIANSISELFDKCKEID